MMSALRFAGGGSLEGAELELPGHVTGVVTIDRDGRSWYVRTLGGTYEYAGYGEIGEVMSGFMRQFTAAAKRDAEALEAAQRPVGCRSCGSTYGSQGAYIVHFESGEGTRCLPGDARGQLTEVDGVYCLTGSDVARR